MQERSSPERVVDRLVLRLKRHAFGDLLLVALPPFLAACYLAFYLHRAAWITEGTLSVAAVALIVVALLLAVWRRFSTVPTASLAARFIDEKVDAKERFLTLATMGSSHSPSFLVARLRQETTTFLDRIDLGRDFPYRVKRSFVASLIVSLAVVLLFHLILLMAVFLAPPAQPTKELTLLAEKLAETPRLSPLARKLMSLAERLEKEKLSDAEKHALVQELSKEVQKQLGAEQQEQSPVKDLLGQAENALQKLEQQGEGEKQEQKGGGGIKSNLPDKGEGQGKKQSKGNGEGDQRDSNPSESKNLQEGKSAQGETKESQSGQGDKGKGERRDDKLGDEKQRTKESETAKGEQEGKSSKNTSEEIPRGPAPAERFAKPGEKGEGGIKGARFVTVELPEPEAESSSGERGSGKKKAIQPQLPVSNVPLGPADSPEASAEKQPLPLEYRDLIR
jgi:hypothetical protein